jgi:SH3-like domain-containing protein
MFDQHHSIFSDSRADRRDRGPLFRALLLLVVLFGGALAAGLARAAEGAVTGLPLPRFATTRSSPINVRVGPSTRYDIAWVYVKPGTPVEIVQEFDTWRKVRDFDGSLGWVHQSLLSGKRAGLAAPWSEGEQTPLLSGRNADGGVRAWLGSRFRVDIKSCDGKWCAVSATVGPETGRTASYSGYMPQAKLWGVYEGEAFD